MRPSREQIAMEVAQIISKRGSCKRAKVGCVITQNNRIVSTGYNGPPKSMIKDNSLDRGVCSCNEHLPCEYAVHAEANAIYAAAKAGISLEGATLYCNFSPCRKCAEAIIQCGIKKVYYLEEYRDKNPIHLLKVHDVWLKKLDIEL